MTLEGVQQVNEDNLRACLGTKDIPRVGEANPPCNEAGGREHLSIPLWTWPWTPWPLFDPSVFERDLLRIPRWYQARGYYDARITGVAFDDPRAQDPKLRPECDGHGCELKLRISIEEGDPIRVKRVTLRGIDTLPKDLKPVLREALQLKREDVFDEIKYNETKVALLEVLARHGYAHAELQSDVKIIEATHEAFILFRLKPNLPGIIGEICVKGNEDISHETILGVTDLEQGQTFNADVLSEAQHAIFSLGVFSSVELHIAETHLETDLKDFHCVGSHETRKPNTEPINIHIHVHKGKLTQLGLGLGLQVGNSIAFGFGSLGSQIEDSSQWDIHALLAAEHRNLFGSLLRARLEYRPRLIFPAAFPQVEVNTGSGKIGPRPGHQLTLGSRWPGIIEPRTSLFFNARYDYGPMPILNFFRHDFDAQLGLERTFFDGKLFASIALRGNIFIPDDQQHVADSQYQREETEVLYLEGNLRLDLRDDGQRPRQGTFLGLNLQQSGLGGISSWDYTRVAFDGRAYLPLPLGAVLAVRGGIAFLKVHGIHSLNPGNIYSLAQLGPPSQQIRGGGATHNRGYAPGFLGDTERRPIPASGESEVEAVPDPILISAGTERWEASVELRVPVFESFGVVVFADAGDVSRGQGFRFNHMHLSFGGGLRYYTSLGPIRLDVAMRPDDLQVIGTDSRPPLCTQTQSVETPCRLYTRSEPFGFPGAIHITIGEAF